MTNKMSRKETIHLNFEFVELTGVILQPHTVVAMCKRLTQRPRDLGLATSVSSFLANGHKFAK